MRMCKNCAHCFYVTDIPMEEKIVPFTKGLEHCKSNYYCRMKGRSGFTYSELEKKFVSQISTLCWSFKYFPSYAKDWQKKLAQ